NQTYKNLEIMLSDDASSDNTVNILKEYKKKDKRIKIIKNKENLGISLNMNNGIKQCTGKYIAILDSDDWAYPYRIEEQVILMESNPKIILCSGYMDICDENLEFKNRRTYPITDKDIRRAIVRYNPISHPASMWRMSALLKTQLYDEKFPICRDYDLIVRISKFGEYRNIPKSLIKYRVRKDSATGERIRETQWYSFYIQMKAVFEYDFKFTFGDGIFTICRLIATVLLPVNLQRYIANRFSK
ncbi:glycosyltransferase, partial [Candidatus Dojkabacteria bacterium]|nr:glycosyltransferase [Candidatus Dojkabacteria bacterium]